MPEPTDVDKINEVFEKYQVILEKALKNSDTTTTWEFDACTRGMGIIFAYQVALQIAKLNENIIKLDKTLNVHAVLSSGGGYPSYD